MNGDSSRGSKALHKMSVTYIHISRLGLSSLDVSLRHMREMIKR
jgi:hypothetical protein